MSNPCPSKAASLHDSDLRAVAPQTANPHPDRNPTPTPTPLAPPLYPYSYPYPCLYPYPKPYPYAKPYHHPYPYTPTPNQVALETGVQNYPLILALISPAQRGHTAPRHTAPLLLLPKG
jgi:hypothetical protein